MIVWTLALSLTLHIIALISIPRLSFDQNQSVKILTIKLDSPNLTAPKDTKKSEPIKQVEQKAPNPKPIPKLVPKPQMISEPSIKQNTANAPTEPSPEPVTPPVILAQPNVESTPTIPPQPVPEPAKTNPPNPYDIESAKNQYASMLASEIAKHKQYPRIAQMRGWQGEVLVDLQLDENGIVITNKIHKSSGFEVLDKQALEMATKAAPFPLPPDVLKGRPFNLIVPVTFRLE